MSAPEVSRRGVYWAVGGVVAVLLVVLLVFWDYSRPSDTAQAKAQELVSAYAAAGLPTPANTDQVAEVLGEDGGQVCRAAGSPQQLGYLKTQYRVGGEFWFRPVVIDRQTVQGLALIVRTYCPGNLDRAQEFVDGLGYAPVVTG